MRLKKEFGPIVLSIAYCRGRDGNRQIVCCHLGHQMFFMYRSCKIKTFFLLNVIKNLNSLRIQKRFRGFFHFNVKIQTRIQVLCSMQ